MNTRFALSAALLLAACSNPNMQSPEVNRINPKTGEVETQSPTKQLEAGLLKAFPDIPLPANHKVDLERSVIFTSPSQTVGKLSTAGSGTVAEVYAFYSVQMPINGWKLVNSFQSVTSSLYFAKTGKFAALIIEADGRSSTRVTINVGPE